MAIITLTTDLGTSDYYVAALKGKLLQQAPDVKMIDITHDVRKYDIGAGAFIVKNTWQNFPEGTIHIVGVKSERTPDTDHVVVEKNGHYFIGADNGLFSLVFAQDLPDRVFSLYIPSEGGTLTFPTRDVFLPAAAHLSRGGKVELLGKEIGMLRPAAVFEPVIDHYMIRARVLYIDSYGNIISNITREMFAQARQNRTFEITFRDPSFRVKKISQTYSDVEEGDVVALFGSSGYLEIAINGGEANKLLGVGVSEMVSVEFYDH
tara:strand:- start:8462 stop:9250 length:789 start_codon:yes stop_codon:yes gene_type:complete